MFHVIDENNYVNYRPTVVFLGTLDDFHQATNIQGTAAWTQIRNDNSHFSITNKNSWGSVQSLVFETNSLRTIVWTVMKLWHYSSWSSYSKSRIVIFLFVARILGQAKGFSANVAVWIEYIFDRYLTIVLRYLVQQHVQKYQLLVWNKEIRLTSWVYRSY